MEKDREIDKLLKKIYSGNTGFSNEKVKNGEAC